MCEEMDSTYFGEEKTTKQNDMFSNMYVVDYFYIVFHLRNG